MRHLKGMRAPVGAACGLAVSLRLTTDHMTTCALKHQERKCAVDGRAFGWGSHHDDDDDDDGGGGSALMMMMMMMMGEEVQKNYIYKLPIVRTLRLLCYNII